MLRAAKFSKCVFTLSSALFSTIDCPVVRFASAELGCAGLASFRLVSPRIKRCLRDAIGPENVACALNATTASSRDGQTEGRTGAETGRQRYSERQTRRRTRRREAARKQRFVWLSLTRFGSSACSQPFEKQTWLWNCSHSFGKQRTLSKAFCKSLFLCSVCLCSTGSRLRAHARSRRQIC